MHYAKDMLGKAGLCRANSSAAGIPPGIRGQISFRWRVNVCLPGAHQRLWWGQELLEEGLAAPGVNTLSHLRQKLQGADCKGSVGDERFCRETAGAT